MPIIPEDNKEKDICNKATIIQEESSVEDSQTPEIQENNKKITKKSIVLKEDKTLEDKKENFVEDSVEDSQTTQIQDNNLENLQIDSFDKEPTIQEATMLILTAEKPAENLKKDFGIDMCETGFESALCIGFYFGYNFFIFSNE